MRSMIKENWQAVLRDLQAELELSDISFKTWIRPLEVAAETPEEVTVRVQGGDMKRDYIEKKYLKALAASVERIAGRRLIVRLVTEDPDGEAAAEAADGRADAAADEKRRMREAGLTGQYTFEGFVTGDSNQFAQAAAWRTACSPGEFYNPLFIYSGAGLGKTHLLQAIGMELLSRFPDKSVVYVSGEAFMNELISCIRGGRSDSRLMDNFRRKYRGADVLLLDDIQFLLGKEATLQEFYHTFDLLYEHGKQIVIASDRPPREMELPDEHYRQRFSMGLQCDITPPDYELRMAILQKKCEAAGAEVPQEVLSYIAGEITDNVRDLEGALTKVTARSKLLHEKISLSMAAGALEDMISRREQDAAADPERILAVTAEVFGVQPSDIAGRRQTREAICARGAFMYLCREITGLPQEAVGRLADGRNHSTVAHTERRVEKRLETDPDFAERVNRARGRILGTARLGGVW